MQVRAFETRSDSPKAPDCSIPSFNPRTQSCPDLHSQASVRRQPSRRHFANSQRSRRSFPGPHRAADRKNSPSAVVQTQPPPSVLSSRRNKQGTRTSQKSFPNSTCPVSFCVSASAAFARAQSPRTAGRSHPACCRTPGWRGWRR